MRALYGPPREVDSRHDELQRVHRNARRATPTNIAFWRRLRARVLAEQPVCAMCKRAPATEVDHIDENTADNRRENLQALCRPCHSRKTNAPRRRPRLGCDIHGNPSTESEDT